MEDNVVLADEVHQTALVGLPPLLPALRKKLLSIGNVANRSIEPNIKNLALGTIDRNGDTPIKVAANGTRLQATVQPALALTVNVALPLLMLLKNPVAQPGLVLVKRQIPVLGLNLHGSTAAEG